MKLTAFLCALSLQLLAEPVTPELLQPYSANMETYEFSPIETSAAAGISHAPLDMMLKKYVSASGSVNYAGFKNDPTLGRYLGILESADPKSMSRAEQKAFWINVYNIYTIKLIIDNYPLKSINDIGSPWDKKFIRIAGNNYSLNQVENEILRPQFNDARVHFAINCASISCPKLHNRAFTAENLESKLDKLTREFVNGNMNELTPQKVMVSKIFDWYAVDFITDGSLIDWLNKYADIEINSDAAIAYKKYDWGLNGN